MCTPSLSEAMVVKPSGHSPFVLVSVGFGPAAQVWSPVDSSQPTHSHKSPTWLYTGEICSQKYCLT